MAATMWSFYEYRKSRNPSCKKVTLKDFITPSPSLKKVKNVDDGGDRVGGGVVLKNSKLLVDGSETGKKYTSSSNLLLDVKKRSKLGVMEGTKIEENGCYDAKEDGLVCEADQKKMHDCLVLTASEHEGIKLVVKPEPVLFAPPEIVSDEVITESSDSSTESNYEAVCLVKPSSEIVEVEEHESEIITSANSIHKEERRSTLKDQMMTVQGSSTDIRIWVTTVALLVLLGALIAQQKYFSSAQADDVSSISRRF